MSYQTSELERQWKQKGWFLVTRTEDEGYLSQRERDMRRQDWQTVRVPRGRRVVSLFTAPRGVLPVSAALIPGNGGQKL